LSARAGEGRERDRDTGESPRRLPPALPLRLLGALLRLNALPQALDRLWCEPLRVAEDVGMAAHELLGESLNDVAEIEFALLLRHAGVEYDLQQQVAELVAQVVKVAARNSVGDLIRLLDGVGGDGCEVLRQVPRATAARRA
jgi:hypothetical protein